MSSGEVYVERYGFPPKTIAALAGALVFVLAVILLPVGMLMRVGGLVLFGGGGLLMLLISLTRRVALRVDATGITLGGIPPRYVASTDHVPWRDVESVVLWRQASAANLPYVGVLRRDGASPVVGTPAGPVGSAMMNIAEAVAGAPDDRLVTASRAINGWRLDTERLAAALRHFAPDVPLIDER